MMYIMVEVYGVGGSGYGWVSPKKYIKIRSVGGSAL